MKNRRMKLRLAGVEYQFIQIGLTFDGKVYKDIFGQKNNKSVKETLKHRRYVTLKDEVIQRCPADIEKPLGSFLLGLKNAGDRFYKRFLNTYGDLTYSVFFISEIEHFESKGVYAYLVDGELKYIGRCKDSMKKRINQGYGKIHPKNCYLDGQATNCHLNDKITAEKGGVTLWLHQMDSNIEIEALEKKLIQAYNPPWNIQRG